MVIKENIENQNVKSALNKMKNEVASELGVDLKSDTLTSREAGMVGGQMTKRLIEKAKYDM